MASIKSVAYNSPKFTPVDGCAAFYGDKVMLVTAPAVGDTLDFKVPGGTYVYEVSVQSDDLDTNATPALAFSVGYAPADSTSTLAANATYFAAAGQTTARTGGRLMCAFKPIKFEEDVIVRLTIGTAAATFAAGEVHLIVAGNTDGVK